jgi:aspartate/methionine/tyrosine aminotransferase
MGGALDNLIVFHTLSKRSSVPGLRAGFAAGDPLLLERFLKLREYGGNPIPLPVQATAAALWRDEAHAVENRAKYVAKFDLAERTLGNRFGFYRPAGGFFLWLEVGDGVAAARRLWTEAAVRTLPGSYLTMPDATGPDPGHDYLRVALVPDHDSTAEALRRIAETL